MNVSRGVLTKRCSENMQQIYRKCDFNKVNIRALTYFIFVIINFIFISSVNLPYIIILLAGNISFDIVRIDSCNKKNTEYL